MNPSILTWERQRLGLLHMPKGLNVMMANLAEENGFCSLL